MSSAYDRGDTSPSIVNRQLTMKGDLESDGDIQIDGTVDGDIRSGRITVSETAVVKGALEAETVRIAGKVTGQIKARQVTLLKSAKVVADLSKPQKQRHVFEIYFADEQVSPDAVKVRHILFSTMIKDPENPMGREMPLRNFVEAKLQEEKEQKRLQE